MEMKETFQKLMPLNIQLFAESGEGEGEVTTTETVDNTEGTTEPVEGQEEKQPNSATKPAPKTYTRAEVEAIKKSEREAILKEFEEKQTEAQKLSKMTADEKRDHELQKERLRAEKSETELNAYKLKEAAVEIAEGLEIPISLLGLIDFKGENAETVPAKLDLIKDAFTKAVQDEINKSHREKSPKTVSTGNTEQQFSFGFSAIRPREEEKK